MVTLFSDKLKDSGFKGFTLVLETNCILTRLGGDHSTGPRQRTGIVAEGGLAHPDDTPGGALQPGWRTGSPWLLDRCDEEAGREEQSSPTFDLQ